MNIRFPGSSSRGHDRVGSLITAKFELTFNSYVSVPGGQHIYGVVSSNIAFTCEFSQAMQS